MNPTSTAAATSAAAVTTPTTPTRRTWTTRLTTRLGSYGVTAAIAAGTLAAFVPMCAPATTEQQTVAITNQHRAANGLRPLTINTTLTGAAQNHANDQASVDTMSHTGTDGSDPGTRIIRSGYPVAAWGENVAGGYATPDTVMTAWMNSPGHRANILNNTFTHIGIAIAYAPDGTPYWAMEFGRPQ